MTTGAVAPRLDAGAVRSIRFSYDAVYDIALLLIGMAGEAIARYESDYAQAGTSLQREA